MAKLKDYTGEVFGNFKVIEDLGLRYRHAKSTRKIRYAKVKCIECSNVYEGEYQSFKSFHRRCECKHIHTPVFTVERKRIYKIFHGMESRCNNKSGKNYNSYGARGIKISSEWPSYKEFYEWAMKNGYAPNLTIDRINNDGNYEPSNCRWATPKEQARNKSNTISVETVKKIKKLLNEGYTHHVIADMVKTTNHRVSLISRGASWVDIN